MKNGMPVNIEKGANSFMHAIACLVSIGGILYGYDIGVISGALLFIQSSIPMTDTEVGLIVGAVLGGGLLGTLIAGPIGDAYGRKKLIMGSSFVFILGILAILFANSFLLIFLARMLLGVGIGVIAVAVPLYVSEIVPAANRGKYMTMFQLLLTFGIVMAYFVDLFFTASGNWRAMFAVALIPAIGFLLGIIYLPESPRWLISQNKITEARAILSRTHRTSLTIEEDIKIISNSFTVTKGTWKELFHPDFLIATLAAIGIATFNQLTGINSFLQYAPLILKNAGIDSNIGIMLGSGGIGVLNFICTIIALLLIDNVGRRPLLLLGVSGVILSEIFLGSIQYLHLTSHMLGILSLFGLFGFIVCFAIGPGVVVWLAISELFPTRVRGKGIAICLFFNSLAATLLATFFIPITKWLGMGETYFLFAAFGFLYLLLVWFLFPETKTKSLEEIQFQFQKTIIPLESP